MFRSLRNAITPSKGGNIAKAFKRLGWAGFWLQVVFGSLPVILLVYYLTFSRSANVSRSGLPFVEYLAIVSLLTVLFTIYWSYRYTRIGKRLEDPAQRPTESYVVGTVWTGVVASTIGMLFSMVVMLFEAANLLFAFLKAPQGGIPVVQTTATETAKMVTSADMVSLMALILTLFAELIVLVFSLWLLFRTTLGSEDLPADANAK